MSLKPVFPQFPILAVVLLTLAVPPAHIDMPATFDLAFARLAALPVTQWLLVNAMTLFHQLAQVWRLLSC